MALTANHTHHTGSQARITNDTVTGVSWETIAVVIKTAEFETKMKLGTSKRIRLELNSAYEEPECAMRVSLLRQIDALSKSRPRSLI